MEAVDFIQRGNGKRIRLSGSLGAHFLNKLQQYGTLVAQVQEVDGVEVSVTYSELLRHGKVVAGLLRQHGLGSGDTVDGVEVSVTYSELLRHGKVVAGLLRQHGVGSGDTVMLCCGNTLDYVPIMLGTLFVGAALGPVHVGYDTSDMLHSLNTLKPQIVISNSQGASSIQEALTQYNTPVVFIPMEAVNKCIAESPDVEDFFLGKVDDPDQHVAFVTCSSGTSGKPKGVEITHTDYMHRMILPWFRKLEITTGQQEVYLNPSGPFWMTIQMFTFICLHRGIKMFLLTPFTPETYLQSIQKYGVHHVIFSPFEMMAFANFTSMEKYDISSLCTVRYAGAPISDDVWLRTEKNLSRKITNSYGMTECVGTILNDFQDDGGKLRHIGKPLYDSEVKISDIETGQILGPNMMGEICTKSITTFKGYRGNLKATEEAFDEDGFLRSGDLGYYDEDGYFYIDNRVKETFKYMGIFINTGDIEDVLLQNPSVSEVAVIGIRNEQGMTRATACVILHPGAKVTAQELIDSVQSQLPSYKWLHGGVHFIDSFPRSPTGKIQKQKLRMSYENPKEIAQQ